jgi:ABC-2 type transport system ATP-binding protein
VNNANVVTVKNLSMQYGLRTVLDDVSFSIQAGQIVAVLGPNGAGKSTMIEILVGFRRPSSGEVTVLGHEPVHAPEEWKSRLGVVLQAWRDHGLWKVRDFLEYVVAAHHSVGRTDTWDIKALLEQVGLAGVGASRIRALSGGQRRRVDVAAALVAKPELLFLDEPTTGFDPEVRREFHELIRSLPGSPTVFWATHDLREAESMCDRILILNHGRIIADNSPEGMRLEMASDTTVSWKTAEGAFEQRLLEPNSLVRSLLERHEDIHDLEVHKGTLEEAYLSIVSGVDTASAVAAQLPQSISEGARV